VPIQQYRLSVIAFYDKAIPVVIDTRDIEVVKNCFTDIPLHYAFKGKQTNLFAGLEAAANLARPWNPESTILIVVTDGDTVPATGMPKLPASIARTLLVGIGDPIQANSLTDDNLAKTCQRYVRSRIDLAVNFTMATTSTFQPRQFSG
jgi:Ca-activated chloride channel family protein